MGRLLVNIRDAAAMLGLSERTIRRLQDRGDLPTTYVGNSRRVSVAALERLAANGTRKDARPFSATKKTTPKKSTQ